MQETKQLWVYLPLTDGKPRREGWELLATGQALLKERDDYTLCVFLYGENVMAPAQQLADAGVSLVYACECPSAQLPDHRLQAVNLQRVVQETNPDILLFPSDAESCLLAAMLGQRLHTGVICHCMSVTLNEQGLLYGVIPAYGGTYVGDIICPQARPQIATTKTEQLQFQPQPNKGHVVFAGAAAATTGLQLLTIEQESLSQEDLQVAEVIVCGGLGVGSLENWQAMTHLAQHLQAAVACTRPPIDEDWDVTEDVMIGTSGKTVRPKVYLGFGISGTAHHVCGMQDSGLILNVNTNDQALSCQISDYAYIGNATEIIPKLLQMLAEDANCT